MRIINRYRDFDIYHYPIPDGSRFIWQHVDYDGPDDHRYGVALSIPDAVEAIDAFLAEEEEHARQLAEMGDAR